RRPVTAARRSVAAAAIVLLAMIPASAAERCLDCLQAGAATVSLPVPPGTPLAGYGNWARRLVAPDLFGRFPHAFWFRPHDGVLDPVVARALVLETAETRVVWIDRKSTRLNSSHDQISYAVFCLKKKKQ